MNFFERMHHLPLSTFGLKNVPAFPVVIRPLIDTLIKLLGRQQETLQAKQGLSNTYTIANHTAIGYEFLFSNQAEAKKVQAKKDLIQTIEKGVDGVMSTLHQQILTTEQHPEALNEPAPLTALSLEAPAQFALSLTTFDRLYKDAEPYLKDWAATLENADEATRSFWPMIATYGLAYNLLIIQKIDHGNIEEIKNEFKAAWNDELEAAQAAGSLYAIDMTLFQTTASSKVRGSDRFTPGTYTLLKQDLRTKALIPFVINVYGDQQQQKQSYLQGACSDGAWLYALQAAKTSVTVYGIWLGHVYHWHLVTAAMQMTMHNHLPTEHPVYQLLAPQSDYLIAFNNVLMLLWSSIAPPTSISTPLSFLKLANTYGAGRSFFDDDPKVTLKNLGIAAADFSVQTPWDQYPIVKTMLTVWDATEQYVTRFVKTNYPDDAAIIHDVKLQEWITASGDSSEGNIKGLPEMKDTASLVQVLTSLVYRITMHGASRLNTDNIPAFSFVSNFPPCLQSTTLPDPDKPFSTTALLRCLPQTGSIGEMISFLFIFVFSAPYKPFVPMEGTDANLFFSGGMDNPCNQGLREFRDTIKNLTVALYKEQPPQIFQWPLNIET